MLKRYCKFWLLVNILLEQKIECTNHKQPCNINGTAKSSVDLIACWRQADWVVDALQIYISSALTMRQMIIPQSSFHNP